MNVPVDATWFWRLLHLSGYFLKLFFCRIEVKGRENVPLEGGLIFACNHNMGPDYVILGWTSPRQVYFMAKSDIFYYSGWLTWFLHQVGTFPVERGRGGRGAVTASVKIVEQGKALGMFPEGTRSRDGNLQAGRSGVARIALAAQTPILPVVVLNSEKVLPRRWLPWNRPLVTIEYGKPFPVTGDPANSADIQLVTERTMREIAALLPPARRGAYA
ncbi:MAG: 1-acyl-sn-glycerol-3-phosphate acyltransferase [Caldilineaceae bacterium]|nr:1-acyl-sn-glycerol-3-phosphate acyltransferase [Caldilineaceae bacterium]